MVNLGALNLFDSLLKSWKKELDCVNHVIYTPDIQNINHECPSHNETI